LNKNYVEASTILGANFIKREEGLRKGEGNIIFETFSQIDAKVSFSTYVYKKTIKTYYDDWYSMLAKQISLKEKEIAK
jgi:hypothetical protein